MLSYPKITELEDQARNLLEMGEYRFTVKYAELKKTRSGEYDMLQVDLLIDHDNRKILIKDWMVFMPEMAWKFRHFASTLGLIDRYENDTLDISHMLGAKGVAKIGTKSYEKDGESRMTNNVVDYMKKTSYVMPAFEPVNKINPNLNDDIPF